MNEVNERLAVFVKDPPNYYLANDWNGTYLVDMGDAGRSRFKVSNGHVEILDADGDADCRLTCSPDDGARFMDGSLNMLTALMRNRLSLQGDLGLAQRLHAFVRARTYGTQGRITRG